MKGGVTKGRVIASGSNPYEQSRVRLLEAVSTLAKAGVAFGTIRDDVETIDPLTSLSGWSPAAVEPAQSDRLLDLLTDSLRYRA